MTATGRPNPGQTAEFLAGSTPLRVATITDGQFLKRVGSEIQSAAAGGSVSLLFGDGSTGSGTIVNTTLITDAYYGDLTIPVGVVLKTAGFRLFVKGTLTLNGAIRNNGVDGIVGSAGQAGAPAGTLAGGTIGGSGGNPSTPGTDQANKGVGGGGGSGGNASNSAGSIGGTVFLPATNEGETGILRNIPGGMTGRRLQAPAAGAFENLAVAPGAGGGGGGVGASGIGGGSGGGGGGGVIVAAKAWAGTGVVEAKGGNGGNPGGEGGGGGGGGGGFIVAISGESGFGSVTFSVEGGALGLGDPPGQNGSPGSVGQLVQITNA